MRDKAIGYIWKESVYAVISIIFLLKLNAVNNELAAAGLSENPLNVLAYNNGEPITLFILAIALCLIGVVLAVFQVKKIFGGECETGTEVLLRIVAFIVLAILIFLIIVLINNPIARAIMLVGGATYVAISAASNG